MTLIRVRVVDGKTVAKVEPNGPEAEARDPETAVEFAKKAHQAYLRSYEGWIPGAVLEKETQYRIEWVLG